ncbi:hypothetical protein HanPI659440_Chr07g0259481 [Helianthus annuus]|nr:hypothetical protein HanPI659440_Chr07g0259481 [Helianthus annuus]
MSDEEFYNAFASSPSTPAAMVQNMNMENETGTLQKPPKLIGIEEYYGWKDRFENWVQANHLRSWECIEKKYVRSRTDLGVTKAISELNDKERDMYKAEKMMISLLQQAVKEDIFILLQHDNIARSIWDALKVKFEGSEKMIKSKKALLKKEFDLFSSLAGETSKKLIERYCHLVRSLSLLGIEKSQDEWVDKLADALPQKEWGTFLMILKNTGEYDGLTISQFIEKIESQDLEQQKIARMNNPSNQQDVKMYYKGGVQDVEMSPKIQTAFSAGNSSDQSPSISSGISSYPSVNPKSSTSSFHSQSSKSGNGCVIQCNIALNLPNGQSLSEEVARDHMTLLATLLETYEGLVAGRIGNPMLTKEDYDQIDAEETELMDIKWEKGHFKRECKNQESSGAKNLFGQDDYYRKAIYQQVAHQPQQQQKEPQIAHARMIEDANKKAYYGIVDQDDEKVAEGFSWDKYIPPDSKVVSLAAKVIKEPDMFSEWMKVFANNEKNRDEEFVSSDEISERTTVFDQTPSDSGSSDDSSEKTIEFDQSQTDDSSDDEEEEQINIAKTQLSHKIFQFYFADRLEKLKKKQAAKELKREKVEKKFAEKDEKLSEKDKMIEKLLFDLNYVKESYDVLNRTVTGLQKTNSEKEDALTMLNAVMMSKQKAINFYIEESAKWKQELETEKIENERIRRLLQSYSSFDYLIDQIYPTIAGMEAFQEDKPRKKDTGKK